MLLGLLIRSGLTCIAVATLLWAVFLVRLGDQSLYDHLRSIADSQEARELSEELERVGDDLRKHTESVRAVVEDRLREHDLGSASPH